MTFIDEKAGAEQRRFEIERLRAASGHIEKQILDDLFPEQRRFVEDESQQHAALCSRRAGKSHGIGAKLSLSGLRYPGTIGVYIALTRQSAKRILWPELKRVDSRYRIGIVFNHTDLTARLPNGSEIWLTGAHDEADIEKLRGNKYKAVGVDECASFGAFFGTLIEEVLEPALIDQRGILFLAGTPGAACTGLFYDVTTQDRGWNVHRWTILDNPHIPHAKEYLEKKKQDKGWTETNSIYQREWCGKWVRSIDSLVYRIERSRNVIPQLPNEIDFEYVLGVDLGTMDEFSISVLAYSDDTKRVYVCDGFSASRLIPDQWEAQIRNFQQRYSPVATVVDCGALGKAIVENFQSHGLVCEAADKSKKSAFIEMLNGDLESGRMQIVSGLKVIEEMELLQWDPEAPGKEDERFANNNCDSMLYAWRKCLHHFGLDKDPEPKRGTKEALELEARSMRERMLKRVHRESLPQHEQLIEDFIDESGNMGWDNDT